MLQSFALGLSPRTNIGDETGTVLAAAVKENAVLQSLALTLRGSDIGDETGTALAAAIQENAVLQSVWLDLAGSDIGDKTGTALAAAVKENAMLQSFTPYLDGTNMGDETHTSLEERIDEVLQRNRQLPSHWLAVATFARHATRHSGYFIPESVFRRAVFEYFLPGGAAERLAARTAARQRGDRRQCSCVHRRCMRLHLDVLSAECGAAA